MIASKSLIFDKPNTTDSVCPHVHSILNVLLVHMYLSFSVINLLTVFAFILFPTFISWILPLKRFNLTILNHLDTFQAIQYWHAFHTQMCLFVTSHEILPLHMAWFCYKCCILLFSFVLCFLQDKDWVSKSRYMLSKYPVFIDTFSSLYEDECPIDILKWPDKSLNVGRCLKLFRGVHIWWYHSRKDTIRIIKNSKKSSDNINSNKNK